MKIRRYKDSDKTNILGLLRLNTPEYFSPAEEESLMYYLDDHGAHYYVVLSGNEILAGGGFNLSDEPGTVRIAWDIVHPQYHGKGLGSELIKFRIQRIKEKEGVKRISVRTSQFAYQFYARFGFELKEIIKDFWAEGFDLYRMDCAMDPILFIDSQEDFPAL
jgi:ribosomal-protein-alanine N-acetyltransferase